MKTMFKKTFMLNEKDKIKLSEMSGKILIWIMEGRHIGYMSEKLDLHPYQIEHNIDETLYILRKHVGKKRYIKNLFWK